MITALGYAACNWKDARTVPRSLTIILKTKAAGARPTALYKRNGCGAWCNRAYMPLGLVSQDARLSENSHSCCKDKHISLIFQTFEQRIQRKMHFSYDESWKSSAKAKLFPTFFFLEGIITNIICIFAPAIRLMRQRCHLRMMESCG